MTFRQFVIRNVFRNRRLYAAYFLSSMFTVMVFFTFANFAFHPVFYDGSINSNALRGMGVAGGLIYVFSFFFVLYSMSVFLQSRKKEFGVLMIHGMSTRQIRSMVFLENLLIGVVATMLGIGLGLLFSKAVLLIAENVLIISESLSFYMPWNAVAVTFLSFTLLFFFISLFVAFLLRTKKLTSLIKSDQSSKGEPKASKLLVAFSVLLLTIGYGLALTAEGLDVIRFFLPVAILVTIGTYFLFTQLNVFLVHRLKKRKTLYWKKTNMILLSDLAFRMKDNARAFFMVAIISTVAFSAIGSLYGAQSYLTKGLIQANPYDFTYNPVGEEAADKRKVEKVSGALEEEGVEYQTERVTMSAYNGILPEESVWIIPDSLYNTLASMTDSQKVEVGQREAVVIYGNLLQINTVNQSRGLMEEEIPLVSGETISPSSSVTSNVLPGVTDYYVVSEETYESLPEPETSTTQYVWQVESSGDEVVEVGLELAESFPPGSLTAIDAVLYQINKSYGPVLFIGLFIGIVFFLSAGSFLYFRLYTDFEEDRKKFSAIRKMGLTDKEMNRVVTKQTGLLFFAPIIVALVHGAVALSALSSFFDYNLVQEAAYVLGGFAVIQVVYFVVARTLYTRQLVRQLSR
ncbi:ABC transporter permease [Salimicrobium halophilum]|uniref:Putative ABC transport system permease protein n=1 Tax=Salimicrobium halophilum TaxID=86666 RepID=A0A1G8UU28_9BACI|nr:ABC transporter permease [Salimicrobium halophilum]SDJ56450.1 putative ABC transport system permease protein [Salimicrobium halophilum]